MNCRSAEDEIQKSLDGALTPGERARLDAHAASCASCRRAWEEGRRLARASGRWARPRPEDDPGDIFTAQVLARIAARPAPSRPPVWLPLAATTLLLALLAWLPGLLPPGLDVLSAAARQTPDWLAANLRGVPADALTAWGTLTSGVPVPSWIWAALLLAAAANGVFCVGARQAQTRQARRSVP